MSRASNPTAPRVLVLGGTGEVGASVVAACCELGFPVTAASRNPPSSVLERELFAPRAVPWVAIADGREGDDAVLRDRMAEHDVVVLACEPWRILAGEEREAIERTRAWLAVARAASARRKRARRPPLRVVRIGSPVAEVPLPLTAPRANGYEEDRFQLEEVEKLGARDRCWRVPYFVAKVGMAKATRDAARSGLDVVTAAPTGLVCWWGDKGREDSWVRAYHESRGLVPLFSFPTNILPCDVAARSILAVALAGTPGGVYQVPGVVWHSWDIQGELLRQCGRRLPPAFHLTRQQMLDGVRVYQEATTPLDAVRRKWLHDVAGARDYGMAALLQNDRPRSAAKLRSLLPALGPFGERLVHPMPARIASELPEAARRRARWLRLRGLVETRTNLR